MLKFCCAHKWCNGTVGFSVNNLKEEGSLPCRGCAQADGMQGSIKPIVFVVGFGWF